MSPLSPDSGADQRQKMKTFFLAFSLEAAWNMTSAFTHPSEKKREWYKHTHIHTKENTVRQADIQKKVEKT